MHLNEKLFGQAIFILAILLLIFNTSLTERLIETKNNACNTSCNEQMGFCPTKNELPLETFLISFISLFLASTGVYMYMSNKIINNEKNQQNNFNEQQFINKDEHNLNLEEIKKGLKDDEIEVLELIKNENGIYQSSIVSKTGFSKVRVSRILDKLEARDLIERKRRGMTNFVVLKLK
jgi:uncharacterized membrane protein